MIYHVKGTPVNRPLVLWCLSVGGEEAFYIPVIRSQPFSEAVPLTVNFMALDGTGWLEDAEFRYFPTQQVNLW